MSEQPEKKKLKAFKPILMILLIFIAAAIWIGYGKYNYIFEPNVKNNSTAHILEVPTGTDYIGLKKILFDDEIINDSTSFNWVANFMKYKKVRPGRFEIKPGWNNRRLINFLKAGKQSTVKIVVNNERTVDEIAGKISKVLEPDSLEIISIFNDTAFLKRNGYTKETFISLFIPNTYDFYWNTKPKDFVERMVKEHDKFWAAKERKNKTVDLKMTPEEIYTLASIVEKETNQNHEKPTIAGVYLNRLEKGMLLQADPTVVFANMDFTIRRVLNKHLTKDSPFNTYLYAGLPPGPISTASIASIDAVLNHEDHNYIYFCAKPNNSGSHAFAKTLAGHNRNANKFRMWLSKRGIRK